MAANKKGTRRNLPGKPNSPKPPIRKTLSVQQEIRLSQLPDPEVLEKYQQIFPDAADIIFKHFENEQEHRQQQEQLALTANIQLADKQLNLIKRAQIFAAVLGTFAILGGVYAAINGAEISGGLLGSGGIVGIIIAFLVSSRLNKQK